MDKNNKKIFSLEVALGLILFIISIFIFFKTNNASIKLLLIFSFLLPSLLCGLFYPNLSILINTIGLIFLFSISDINWGIIGGIGFLFIALPIIPLYFNRITRMGYEVFIKRTKEEEEELKKIEQDVKILKLERYNMERSIEKINKLYILGREIIEHTEIQDFTEHLQRILITRPGVISCSVFIWQDNRWSIISCSKPELKDRFLEYLKEHKTVSIEKQPHILMAPKWLTNQAIVVWPIDLQQDIRAIVLLTTTIETAQWYYEEGAIFIPQITLGFRRIRLFSAVKERSRHDGLTGLYRRDYFIERLDIEIKRSKRYGTNFSILMLDIDYFKNINDTYGHSIGDMILKKVAQIILNIAGPGNLACRYGGEEFILFLYMVKGDETLDIANKIKTSISNRIFKIGRNLIKLTVSIGISYYPENGATSQELINAADEALYWVKNNGRNGIKEYAYI